MKLQIFCTLLYLTFTLLYWQSVNTNVAFPHKYEYTLRSGQSVRSLLCSVMNERGQIRSRKTGVKVSLLNSYRGGKKWVLEKKFESFLPFWGGCASACGKHGTQANQPPRPAAGHWWSPPQELHTICVSCLRGQKPEMEKSLSGCLQSFSPRGYTEDEGCL